MTNLEVLQGSAALSYPIEASAYEIALIKNDVVPNAQFNVDCQKGIDLAISDLALSLIFGVKKIQDDGYSVEMADIPALWKLRAWYRSRWGLPDDSPVSGPILKDASSKW